MDNINERLAFLKTVKPFNILPEEVLMGVEGLLQEVRYTKETTIYLQDESKLRGVELIAEGEYETFFYDSQQNKRLTEHYGKGFCFGGVSVLLNKKRSIRTVIAKKGTVVYFLHRKDFKALCRAYKEFFHYFTAQFGEWMLNDEFAHFIKPSRTKEQNYIASDQFYTRSIETVESRPIHFCSRTTSIREAAASMRTYKTSCMFVKNAQQQIIGYVTDITLRDEVVAMAVDVNEPVEKIMETQIVSIGTSAFVYEAILLMFRTKTRYLLIKKEEEFIGVISRNKLLSDQMQSPFVFIQSVKLAHSVKELRKKWKAVPEIVYQLLDRGVKSEIVNQIITTIADTIALKVIEGVIEEMGPPPAKFVFMVLGSEGRKELTLNTDQDNAIIYEDKANEQRELVREYFLKFAENVSERLDYIGFSFCVGGFMAKNPKWTHSLSHWKRNYTEWMAESNPETVMKFSTFFDCRAIYGDMVIMDELNSFLDKELQNPLYKLHYQMATNALQHEPTLTFFNNIRTFTNGTQQVFDLKKTMSPIVELVRAYALQSRIFNTNTGERLMALKERGVFTEKEVEELMQAYYYLMGLRLKNQARQIINDNVMPNNLLDPGTLTKIEQVAIKEIFKVIGEFQFKIKVAFKRVLFN